MKISSLITLLVLLFSCTEATNNNKRKNTSGDRDGTNVDRPAGTAVFKDVMPSHISRDRGAMQLTYTEINELFKSGGIDGNINYRAVPAEARDNTGESSVALRPSNECGTNPDFSSIRASLNHCTTQNNGTHLWKGEDFGISGEGNWSLIAVKKNPDMMVWMDQRTELLWSHTIARADWIDASGNNNANFPCENIDILPQENVAWRLPTRNEFLQADINGYQNIFVLEDQDDEIYWTATSAKNTDNAWTIRISNGVLAEVDKDTNTVAVKCVGQILK